MIKRELINRSIDYIMAHLEEDISITDVANHCHFSKYYFCRMFKEETGESIYAFIKRIKMDQSAIRIKLEKEKSITDIGMEYGYSSSNYSSAFKKKHKVSPAEFRKVINSKQMANPFDQNSSNPSLTFAEYNQKIQILELEDLLVIYERHIGSYIELGEKWRSFIEKYRGYRKNDTLLLERAYDDPAITKKEQCLYDLCMTIDQGCTLDNITVVKGGKYAVYRFEGDIKDIYAAFQGMFQIWLTQSSYEMDERYGIDIYRSMDIEKRYVEMDLCIPVK